MSETLNVTNPPDYKPVLYTKNTHSNINEQTTNLNQNHSQNFTSPTFILLKKPSDPKLVENSTNNNNTNFASNNTNFANETQNNANEIPQRDSEENSTPPPPEGTEIDDFILKLLHGNDRLTVLKLDSELEKFMRDTNATRLEFPPMSSYQRLIVHRVAQYFKLDHPSIDLGGLKRSVILTKNKDSRTPALRLCDLVEQEEPTPAKSVKILSRKTSSTNSPEGPVILQKNPPTSQKIQSNQLELNEPSLDDESRLNGKSLEEREAEYLRARARIFKDDPNNMNTATNSSSSTSNLNHIVNSNSISSPSLSHSLSNPLPQNIHYSSSTPHLSPPVHHHPVSVPPEPHYAIEKEKKEKMNNQSLPRAKIIVDKPVNVNMMEYPPETMSPWVNNMWSHPSDFSSIDPRSWEKFPPKYTVPIPETPYMVPHSDHDQYPLHYDKRDHHSNPNLINNPNPIPNYNFNHPKPRYNPDTAKFPPGVNDNPYVYYESPPVWNPNYYNNFYTANPEPIYNPHFYAPRQMQTLPQMRRDYERPPPKSTHLFDPNAPQPQTYPRSDNYGNSYTSLTKTPTPKHYYSQPKLKPNLSSDNFSPDPKPAHILEIVGVESNVSCDSELFNELRASGAKIKLLEDNTLVAIFKNSTIAKFSLDNSKSDSFTLQPWSKK